MSADKIQPPGIAAVAVNFMPIPLLKDDMRTLSLIIGLCTFVPALAIDWTNPDGAGELAGYRTSWIGNSSGGLPAWVPQDIAALAVSPEGEVYTDVPWEEGGGNCMHFRDGRPIGPARHTHGWGNQGGIAVAVNAKYVFIGLKMENEGGGLKDIHTWPPKGADWYGVSRRTRADITRAAEFPHGKGGSGDTLPKSFLVVNEAPLKTPAAHVAGLAASADRLYVSNPYKNQIEVYDAESMECAAVWKTPRPTRDLALDAQGNLWALTDAKAGPNLEFRDVFLCWNPAGQPQDVPYSGHVPADVQAFCFDANGNLCVAFRGENPGIFRYTAGKPGRTQVPGVRGNVTALGCDARGNLYVASDWAKNGGGTVLGCLAEDGSWTWVQYGLGFIDNATLDPLNENRAYAKEEVFDLDYDRPAGQEATLAPFGLVRPLRLPGKINPAKPGLDGVGFDDLDLSLAIRDSAGVWVRYFGGERFLVTLDMNSQFLQIYHAEARQDLAVWFGRPVRNRENPWVNEILKEQPERGEWIWRNPVAPGGRALLRENGTLLLSPEENPPAAQGWWIDSAGSVWQATERAGLRRFPFFGLDVNSTPLWDFESMETFPMPKEFRELKRVRYCPETDTLYLGGTTDELRNQHWKPMGPFLCRYDGWLRGERKLTWKLELPYMQGSSGHESCEPMGFDAAGDYIFVPYTGACREAGITTGHVGVYRADNAQPVGFMRPDPQTVGEVGLQDMRECLSAHRRANGEYIIFLEDDYKAKVVMFRWKPE